MKNIDFPRFFCYTPGKNSIIGDKRAASVAKLVRLDVIAGENENLDLDHRSVAGAVRGNQCLGAVAEAAGRIGQSVFKRGASAHFTFK